jgi:hypothetical protein
MSEYTTKDSIQAAPGSRDKATLQTLQIQSRCLSPACRSSQRMEASRRVPDCSYVAARNCARIPAPTCLIISTAAAHRILIKFRRSTTPLARWHEDADPSIGSLSS